ncbi:MAG: 16S rRNA (cytidine(1402)-2'-O)-methyltransferase [Burkholderiales bacterium]|nr:16S rRNA (cytidine(1402)-2'-O)-methyltransferase [Burkholderiales bacterium]
MSHRPKQIHDNQAEITRTQPVADLAHDDNAAVARAYDTVHAAASLARDVSSQVYPVAALYVVATPIGNLCDISIRALHVLGLVDAIACEDTRTSSNLLGRYGVSKPLIAAHQHNEREAAQKIVSRLQQGQRIALISDAGTPAVSDPGARIVDAVRAAGLRVIPLPGASAGVTALSASGLLDEQYYFVGFLPNKSKQREQALLPLLNLPASLIFYEAPHRIAECVHSLATLFPPQRQLVLAREVSKLYEEIWRGTMAQAVDWLAQDAMHSKGEFVVIVQGAPAQSEAQDVEAERVLRLLLAEVGVKAAAQLAAQITGAKKNALYQLALNIVAETGEAAPEEDTPD